MKVVAWTLSALASLVLGCAPVPVKVYQPALNDAHAGDSERVHALVAPTLRCLAAYEALPQGGTTALRTEQPRHDFGLALKTRLDLRSVRSSLGPRLDEAHFRLADFRELPLVTDSSGVGFEDAEWRFRIEVAATADLDHNGREDWILWLTDRSRTASYQDQQVLIAWNPGSAGLVSARPAPCGDESPPPRH